MLSMSGCGARTGLDVAKASRTEGEGWVGGAGSGGTSGAGGMVGGAGAGGVVSVEEDRCLAAVVGPRPMFRNCSTRDGRSRVPAPGKPHVTWKTKLPTDTTGHVSTALLVTGGASDAYVVTTENFADKGAVRRLRTTDGAIAWTLDIAPDGSTEAPVVRANGLVDVYAYDSVSKESVLQIDAKAGTAKATTFGFDLYYAPAMPAVGEDGSLYLVHADDVGTANSRTYVSRVGPGGDTVWTTPDLATLTTSPSPGSDVFPSTLALARNDAVVITVMDTISKSGSVALAVGFDGHTGATSWSVPTPGQLLGGPAILPDGRAVLLAGPANAPNLVIIDVQSGGATTHALAMPVFELYAITRGGVVIAGTDAGQGVDGLIALGLDGKPLWTVPGAMRGATIASDGTVVAFGATIAGLDPSSGATKWSLSPPVPGSCLADVALASDGTIVGIQCDGTVFGAAD